MMLLSLFVTLLVESKKLRATQSPAILLGVLPSNDSGGAAESLDSVSPPCNPVGVSPTLPLDCTCITGQLFTGRSLTTSRRSCLASLKRTGDWWLAPRRVEQSSPECSTKVRHRCLLLPVSALAGGWL